MYSTSLKETTVVPCVMHTQSNAVSTVLFCSIKEYNGWLLTRKGLSAFKLILFTAKISLLNVIQMFNENYHYRFEIR